MQSNSDGLALPSTAFAWPLASTIPYRSQPETIRNQISKTALANYAKRTPGLV